MDSEGIFENLTTEYSIYTDAECSNSMVDYQDAIKDTDTEEAYSYTSMKEQDKSSCLFSVISDASKSISTDEQSSTFSSKMSITTNDSQGSFIGDSLPKSFLQLRGISVANFNMGCNFDIAATIRIMIQYEIAILAIQEHTPWNRELLDLEKTSIQRTCDKWGFLVTISKLQIPIIDKQLESCHRGTTEYEDGRILKCQLEISRGQFATFISTYGIPHSTDNRMYQGQKHMDENDTLQKMKTIQKRLSILINQALRNEEIVYIFGDLQDAPNNSKDFYYGSCKIAKHPFGIVRTCEDLGLECTIFQHWHTLDKPIISRHGSRGGRFIDGMYTTKIGLQYSIGITIVQDTGILSDHDMIINKFDLGIEKFEISKEKEERIDFKSIMNIPVAFKPNQNHPSLNENVFHGTEFRLHSELYKQIQDIIYEPQLRFIERIEEVKSYLEQFEKQIIDRTKNSITLEEQQNGILVQRRPLDAQIICNMSKKFFNILYDICREAKITSKVPIIPAAIYHTKRHAVSTGNLIPGITSLPISKQLNDSLKRTKTLQQRAQILQKSLKIYQNSNLVNQNQNWNTSRKKSWKNVRRFIKQEQPCIESLKKTLSICDEVEMDRKKHTQAIENARNKKFYDNESEYQTYVIDSQGKDEFENYIINAKKKIFGSNNIELTQEKQLTRPTKRAQLAALITQWEQFFNMMHDYDTESIDKEQIIKWINPIKKAISLLKKFTLIIKKIRQEEWRNAKNYYIRIGKFGSIARMTNPKYRRGPIAGSLYPTKPGETIRKAINDKERKEATILSHTAWMDNPPGIKNCHFIDIEKDEVGTHGVSIHPNRIFDDDAQWKYLEGLLERQVNNEVADRIIYAHQRLPELFRRIKSDGIITYPFKYHCISGEYLYPDLENNIRKNIAQGNGKARATGFGIPVLGRLPKVFVDTYIIKCKLQMALRLLDIGTESSLRICIGKPCGGVRPLTVGHDDNVFLNGMAQQAIQKEIARIKLLPENLCSYQKGKGCGDATIIDNVIKEVALQNNNFYLAEIDDDAEKMFDRLYLELQIALLLLAGAGIQGFTEWQCANMTNRTNKLVTDIFVTLLEYKCGLPQGNGFSVEIANLYAMLLLMWWNMDPINPEGSIAPFQSPRHGFPLIAGGILKPISSLAYVDDAKRYVALSNSSYSVFEFFDVVQGYCDLLADLSLVIKMGRNVKKCTIYLYNIPEDIIVPEFTSIAWSYDSQGPVKGSIATVVMRRDSVDNSLICYQVPKASRENAPPSIRNVLILRKYLGVPNNAQLDPTDGKEILIKKMHQRIALIAMKADNILESKITHNMLVCQVATFSPLCIYMTLAECATIDKHLIRAYQYRLNFKTSDAKHSIFLSEKLGGLGLRSFTREYVGALLRDIEVYISNENSLPAHALETSIEEATKQKLWNLFQDKKIPSSTRIYERVRLFHISRKKTLFYHDNFVTPDAEEINYNHTHIMGQAIDLTSSIGFILRDLDHELVARFTDELLLCDKWAKVIGCPNITNRAALGATIGNGNKHFHRYSMLGHIYLFLLIVTEEIGANTFIADESLRNNAIEDRLSRPAVYRQYSFFSGEISALRLASCARITFEKFKNDYAICSFYKLMEWRCSREDNNHSNEQNPKPEEYKIIIDEDNTFRPIFTKSMKQNSENLSKHLTTLLKLKTDIREDLYVGADITNNYLLDHEIIEMATQHDLPIFVSIDGSLEQNGNATVSISIIAPDIKDTDCIDSNAWQERKARILLIRSWKLPTFWGTEKVCINMAETLGFIIGDYTIPSELPVIYITDSNNARTLLRRIKNCEGLTHRKKVRAVKQGINYSLANHLEFLSSQWPHEDQLSAYAKRIYKRGEEICKRWAMTKHRHNSSEDSISSYNENSVMEEDSSYESTLSKSTTSSTKKNSMEKNRYKFDSSMVDILGRTIVLKVFSHQLNSDFSIKCQGKRPSPNIFIISANQIADNAAKQANELINMDCNKHRRIFYPAFSPRWCFTIEGCINTKGATKILHDKLDNELHLRLQHRPKQGLFQRLYSVIGLKPEQIGNESLLRNVVKQVAPSWTRCIYRYPSLANHIWKQWRTNLEESLKEDKPENIPRGWEKIPAIANDIIKACPFCQNNDVQKKIGNMEHLHLYCTACHLMDARSHCHQKIEKAIVDLYNFASMREFGIPFMSNSRKSTLQENLESIATNLEKQERVIVRNSHLITEARTTNIAILGRNSIRIAVLLNLLPPDKLQDYDKYPLAFRLGFIHSIAEKDFDIATASITDVGYLGLFPKPILQTLYQYARDIKKFNQDNDEFIDLIDKLITAFLYRPITMQKTIQLMIAEKKKSLCMPEDMIGSSEKTENIEHNSMRSSNTTNAHSSNTNKIYSPRPQLICNANKCRIMKAKGILRRPMFCVQGKNMCSGCINENLRHRKVVKIEQEIMYDVSPNAILAPILQHISSPISLRQFRTLHQHLPTFTNTKRDDHIFGAARYLANTLGIYLLESQSRDIIDQPMTSIEKKQTWRMATFSCKCIRGPTNTVQFGPRSLCLTCSFLIFRDAVSHITLCPCCNENESWEIIGHPCLACQRAAIVFRNPFLQRFQQQLNRWLHNTSDDSSEEEIDIPSRLHTPKSDKLDQSMLQKRNNSIEQSFQEMKKKATPEQTKYVFENLALLQQNIQSNCAKLKRDLMSQQDTNSNLHLDEHIQTPSKKSNTMRTAVKHGGPLLQICCHNGYEKLLEHHKPHERENGTPDLVNDDVEDKQKYQTHISRKLFQEDSRCSDASNTQYSGQNRIPFAYLDINSDSRNSYFAKKKHERTIKCKERKKLLKEHKST